MGEFLPERKTFRGRRYWAQPAEPGQLVSWVFVVELASGETYASTQTFRSKGSAEGAAAELIGNLAPVRAVR
jgi:hypothetical protein